MHRPHPNPSPPTCPHAQHSRGDFVVVFLTPGQVIRSHRWSRQRAVFRGHGTHSKEGAAPGGTRRRDAAGCKAAGPPSQRLVRVQPRGPALLTNWASQLHTAGVVTGAREGKPLAPQVTSVILKPDRGRAGAPAGCGLGNPGRWTRQEDSTGQVTLSPETGTKGETEGCSGSHGHVLEVLRDAGAISVPGAGVGSHGLELGLLLSLHTDQVRGQDEKETHGDREQPPIPRGARPHGELR